MLRQVVLFFAFSFSLSWGFHTLFTPIAFTRILQQEHCGQWKSPFCSLWNSLTQTSCVARAAAAFSTSALMRPSTAHRSSVSILRASRFVPALSPTSVVQSRRAPHGSAGTRMVILKSPRAHEFVHARPAYLPEHNNCTHHYFASFVVLLNTSNYTICMKSGDLLIYQDRHRRIHFLCVGQG